MISKYGHVFDDEFKISRQPTYDAFCAYFDNISLTKIKNTTTHSVYMARISCLLANGVRCVVAISNLDKIPIGTVCVLDSIRWEALQTRTLAECPATLSEQSYMAKNVPPFSLPIVQMSSSDEMCEFSYNGPFNIKVALMYNKKGATHEFAERGTLRAALETFRTIVSFLPSPKNE